MAGKIHALPKSKEKWGTCDVWGSELSRRKELILGLGILSLLIAMGKASAIPRDEPTVEGLKARAEELKVLRDKILAKMKEISG